MKARAQNYVAEVDPDAFEIDLDQEWKRIFQRHRIDLAKWFLGKDGGYTLREFKQIMKTELEEHPERYTILDPSTQKSDTISE